MTWWDELRARAATNPFAVVAMARLVAHQRSRKPVRQARKRELIGLLYEHRYSREDVLQLLRFIDWLIRLPRELEQELQQELIAYEESMQTGKHPQVVHPGGQSSLALLGVETLSRVDVENPPVALRRAGQRRRMIMAHQCIVLYNTVIPAPAEMPLIDHAHRSLHLHLSRHRPGSLPGAD